MLDSGSTDTIEKDEHLFNKITDLDTNTVMETNGGDANVEHKGNKIGYDNALYHQEAVTNIILVSDAIRKGIKVYFNSGKNSCFNVTSKKGAMSKFPVSKQGLYYIMDKSESAPPTSNVDREVMATTIEDYTARQVAREKKAKELYHNLHAETIPNLKVWLRSNMGKNVLVSCADVDLMEKIFGKDMATLKGKTTRAHPPVVNLRDIIHLLPEFKIKGLEIELVIDVVYINDQSFLHSVDWTIKLRGLSTLDTRRKGKKYTKDMLYNRIDNILRHY